MERDSESKDTKRKSESGLRLYDKNGKKTVKKDAESLDMRHILGYLN